MAGFAAESVVESWRAEPVESGPFGHVRRVVDSARAPLVDRDARRGTDTCLAYFDGALLVP
ncbi:MAG: hypothetical protein R3A48_04400 [Polyangiales bacterium]